MNRSTTHRAAAAVAVVVALGLAGGLPTANAAAGVPAAKGGQFDGRIAFDDAGTGQIYQINPDGSGFVQATHLPPGQHAGHPTWSPDSTHIAFDGNLLTADNRVYEMDADGSHIRQITHDLTGWSDNFPRYTPDGTHLVYVRCPPDFHCAVFLIGRDGKGRHQITPFATTSDQFDYSPVVSPNGRFVAFTRYFDGPYITRTWVSGIDGSNPHPVTRPALEASAGDWTADGNELLVTSVPLRANDGLYLVNVNSGAVRVVSQPAWPHGDLVGHFSPTQRHIVFASDRAYPGVDGQDLWVMDANGTHKRKLPTPGLSLIINSSWGSAPLQPSM